MVDVVVSLCCAGILCAAATWQRERRLPGNGDLRQNPATAALTVSATAVAAFAVMSAAWQMISAVG